MRNLLAKRMERNEGPRARLDAIWYVDADSSYQVSKKQCLAESPYVAVRTLTGEGTIQLFDGKRFLAGSNTLGVFRKDALEHYGASQQGWQFYWYEFETENMAPELLDQIWFIRMSAQEQAELERSFLSMRGGAAYEGMIAEALFNYLLTEWQMQALHTERDTMAVQDILSLLEKGRCSHMCIPELAREAGMCERSFRSAVHAATGLSPKAYMLKNEMEAAMELLRTTNMTITEIAACFDYTSPLYFSRVFKKYFGISPQYVRDGIAL